MALSEQQLYTCISCAIAFLSAEEQRMHYRSDHHRYNMKRRVASLPPVSVETFNEKVIERRTETSIMSSLQGSMCHVCDKTYASENAYRSHINSRKHRETEIRSILHPSQKAATEPLSPAVPVDNPAPPVNSAPSEEASEDEVNLTIDEKIAAARARLSSSSCLFCHVTNPNIDTNLTHMATVHSFFIPDAEYLVDLSGLITYLGEKIAVGNVCIYCSGKGKDFRSLDAVRKHMLDKSHCKIAYDLETDRLELSDFYDFTSSYPGPDQRNTAPDEWEDIDEREDDAGNVDEIIEDRSDSGTDDELDISESELKYGDSPYELVLPSGARIGHRTMRRYYGQSFRSYGHKAEDPESGAGLVRRLLADKNSALIPRKGGYGAYGTGTEVIKARNRGEAREAGRHVREFRDQKKREDFKTKVGFLHNHQKHFRDPLLQ